MAGRSKNPNSDYVVIFHQTGGYRYATTQPYKQDEKTGKLKRHYVYWVNVTEEMKFIPNQRFQLISTKTRKRFVFPKTWEKRLNRKSKGLLHIRMTENGTYHCRERTIQQSILWWRWLSINMWLKRNQLVVNDIMTLAMFPIMTKWNYKQAERWQKYTPLTPSYITRFT